MMSNAAGVVGQTDWGSEGGIPYTNTQHWNKVAFLKKNFEGKLHFAYVCLLTKTQNNMKKKSFCRILTEDN